MNVIFRVLVLNCVSIRREVSNANVPPVDTSKTHMIPQDAGKYILFPTNLEIEPSTQCVVVSCYFLAFSYFLAPYC